jgi:uncharacterized protein YdaU (DUF1376 family)
MRLSTVEHGAYLLLIMDYWTNGSLPDDDEQLARIARMSQSEWMCVRSTLFSLFGPKWRHKRIEKERESAEIKSTKAMLSANKRWKDKKNPRHANGHKTHMRLLGEGNASHIHSSSTSSAIDRDKGPPRNYVNDPPAPLSPAAFKAQPP